MGATGTMKNDRKVICRAVPNTLSIQFT